MSEQKKKLDDFLDALQQYSIPAEPPQEAVDKLLERLSPKADSAMRYPSGRTSNKTIVKFAAAAIFFVVIIVSAVVFYNIEKDKIKNALKMPYKGSPVRQKDQQLEAVTKIKLQQELDQITKRYAARDVKGLIEVLDGGQYETKLAIAYFLGEIGDLPAAEAIEKYASLWTGNIEENPFTKAAAKIRNRHISKSVPAPKIEEDVNDSNELLIQEPNIAKTVKVKELVDPNKQLIEGITCRLFDSNEKAVDGTFFIIGMALNVSKNGSVYSDKNYSKVILEQLQRYNNLCAAYDRDKKYAQSFVWLADSNSYDIYLEPVSTITGVIASDYQINFEKIEIEPQILLPNEASDTVLKKWNINIDNKGQFKISTVPSGMPMRIIVMFEGLQGEVELDKIEPEKNIDAGRIFLQPLPGFENSPAEWTGKLSGIIVNENNEPISHANLLVSIGHKSFIATSDSKGSYRIEGLPFGKMVEVLIFARGYDSNDFTLPVDNRENYIKMYPKGYELLNKKSPNLFVEKWLNCPPITLQIFLGKVVLVEYDNIREPALHHDIQDLIKLTYRYSGLLQPIFIQHKGSWNGKKFNEEEIIQYIRQNNIFFPLGLEGNFADASDKTLPIYKMSKAGEKSISVTQLYLIDKKGIIRACPTMNNLEEWIEKLIAEE